ncbi:hypothetical protein [Piscinibacter defluvii]|uniref:hypothetical protein n=1 Tax=Piscinibacter defluvii TaxID=1796922 RepID=UPI000FDDA00B|nr:hypothetical protein [Piscinibacter defluvii]
MTVPLYADLAARAAIDALLRGSALPHADEAAEVLSRALDAWATRALHGRKSARVRADRAAAVNEALSLLAEGLPLHRIPTRDAVESLRERAKALRVDHPYHAQVVNETVLSDKRLGQFIRRRRAEKLAECAGLLGTESHGISPRQQADGPLQNLNFDLSHDG